MSGARLGWAGGRLFSSWPSGLALFLFLSLSPAFAAFPDFHLALIGALSGPRAVYGLSHRDGALLAAEEFNAAGSAPFRIQLRMVDDEGNSGMAGPRAVEAVTQDGVHALMGSVDSGCTHVLAMVAVKTHTPHVTCVATDPSLTRAGTPWTFRTLADDQAQGNALVAWLKKQKNPGPIAILAASSRYGRMGARTVFRLGRDAGLDCRSPVILTPDGGRAQVENLLREKPAVVIVWTLAQEGVSAIRWLREIGFSGLIAGGDGLATPAFFSESRSVADGVMVTCPYDPEDDSPENQAFKTAFRSRFHREPDSFSAHAYDTVRLLTVAWQKSDGTREGLRQSLGTTRSFRGATGVMGFDESGNDTRRVRLGICRQGELIRLSE